MVRILPAKNPALHSFRCMSGNARKAASICALLVLLTVLQGCTGSGSKEEQPSAPSAPSGTGGSGGAGTAPDVTTLMSKYANLDTSHTSVTKLKASIQPSDGKAEEVQFTIYREHQPGGDEHLLVEFTSPAEERDRDALINVNPQGAIEAVRYGEGSKSFITAKSPTDEESLFGLTLQELIGGEPENYDYKFVDDENFQGIPVYRVEGKLKAGIESRFPRVVMLISKQDATAYSIEAYDSSNELARQLTVQKMDQVSGIWTRMKWTIDNREQHKKIDFNVIDVKYNQNLPESTFTKDHLKQLVAK